MAVDRPFPKGTFKIELGPDARGAESVQRYFEKRAIRTESSAHKYAA